MSIFERLRSVIVGGLLISLLAAVGGVLSLNDTLQRLDLLLYDLVLPLQSPEMSDQIVIVAIDDASINTLGRWPWSRQRHAELIDKLTDMSPRAVALDILFSEPESNSNADELLAEAIERNGRVTLVVAPAQETPNSPISELLPIPILAGSVAALGHADAELDIDGISRHFYQYAGMGTAHWPSIAIAMLELGGDLPVLSRRASDTDNVKHTGYGWVRESKVLIPYSAFDEQPIRVSYADVLANKVSSSYIKDKYILIGATSSGIGDMISTPIYRSHQRMPAIELVAQELNGLLQGKLLHAISLQEQVVLTIIFIIACMTAILIVPIRFGLIITLATLVIVLVSSIYLMLFQQTWFAPVAVFLMLISSWPIRELWHKNELSKQTEKLQKQLTHHAQYHFITGLPNDEMLDSSLSNIISSGDSKILGLIVVRINWPESASNFIGLSLDDSILKTIAERLKSSSNGAHLIAHLSRDDFAILFTKLPDLKTIKKAASELLEQLQKPLSHSDEELNIYPYLGVSVWPADGQDSKELLRKSYTAMFKSRQDGNRRISFYCADIGQEVDTLVELEQAIRYALERNEFEVYYQPQIEAATSRIIGAEALLRWHHPKLGRIGPEVFIPLAEQSGLIYSLGEWVFKTVCRQLIEINQQSSNPIRMAVNLSPLQFSDPLLVKKVNDTIKQTGVSAENIELEVTESALMGNMNNTIEAMKQFEEQGISLAIDDFGTGYSSLQYLQNFPLNRLKIDKSFTQDIGNNNATEITLSIISLAKRMNLSVIAEGVETVEQAEFLTDNGCDELQGYLYSKAVPLGQFIELVHKRNISI